MRRQTLLLAACLVAGLGSPGSSSAALGTKATSPPAADCALAAVVGSEEYVQLRLPEWSQLEAGALQFEWAACRAQQLRRELGRKSELSRQIEAFRAQFFRLRMLEVSLGRLSEGEGTFFTHIFPSTAARLETRLTDLAALSRSPLGAQVTPGSSRMVAQAQVRQSDYVARLRAMTPKQIAGDVAQWQQTVAQYEQEVRATTDLIGTRPDALSALAWLILTEWALEVEGL